jgi:hypothetical protein
LTASNKEQRRVTWTLLNSPTEMQPNVAVQLLRNLPERGATHPHSGMSAI